MVKVLFDRKKLRVLVKMLLVNRWEVALKQVKEPGIQHF